LELTEKLKEVCFMLLVLKMVKLFQLLVLKMVKLFQLLVPKMVNCSNGKWQLSSYQANAYLGLVS